MSNMDCCKIKCFFESTIRKVDPPPAPPTFAIPTEKPRIDTSLAEPCKYSYIYLWLKSGVSSIS